MIKINSNFHPLMFCFSGFSGTGKTTLLSKLISELKEYRVGYIKHDAHGFSMDRPGKDTYIMKEAGAEIIMINDMNHEAIISSRSGFDQEKNLFLDSDILFIEGHKYSNLPKMILVDDEVKIIQEIAEGKVESPLAFICNSKTIAHCLQLGKPCFDRNNIEGIAKYIRENIKLKTAETPLYGLILTGGASSRMKRDKSGIIYHGISQAEYSYNLLSEFCSEVFVSCKKEQADFKHLKKLPQIHDRFIDFGPLGGILSAMTTHRKAAWLVIACDLPMLDGEVIRTLLNERDVHQMATTFYNNSEKRFEPLASLYEPKSYHRMLYFLAEGKTCPQKVLYNSQVKIIPFNRGDSLEMKLANANTPEDFNEISSALEGKHQ